MKKNTSAIVVGTGMALAATFSLLAVPAFATNDAPISDSEGSVVTYEDPANQAEGYIETVRGYGILSDAEFQTFAEGERKINQLLGDRFNEIAAMESITPEQQAELDGYIDQVNAIFEKNDAIYQKIIAFEDQGLATHEEAAGEEDFATIDEELLQENEGDWFNDEFSPMADDSIAMANESGVLSSEELATYSAALVKLDELAKQVFDIQDRSDQPGVIEQIEALEAQSAQVFESVKELDARVWEALAAKDAQNEQEAE
ncbi:MAG: hypothetical protein Q4G30_07360 [Actinomycetaceae bacterium]|nr:hypothetical protein [Actinomycetaceae bacterium]